MRIEESLNAPNVKAIKLKDYEVDYIYDEKTDNFYPSIDDIVEDYEFRDLPLPRYVYGCKFCPFSLDFDWILEASTEDYDEDIMDRLDGYEELEKAIDKFNELNKGEGSYYIDYKTIIDLSEEE